jgi:hypothetical protein
MRFYRAGPEPLWPRFNLIEDNRDSWRADLFSVLAERGYLAWARTKQKAMLRCSAP